MAWGTASGEHFLASNPASLKSNFSIFNVVTDFAAKGDGIADDTAAIQAAINALPANGGLIWLPAGTYLITSTITLKPKVMIQGVGANASKINVQTPTGMAYTPGSITTGQIFLKDFQFAVAGGYALCQQHLSFTHVTNIRMENVAFVGPVTVAGLLGSDLEVSTFEKCVFNLSSAVPMAWLQSTSNGNTFKDNTFLSDGVTASTGLKLDPGVTNTLIQGNNFEGLNSGAVAVDCSGAWNVTINSNYMEGWTGNCVRCNSGVATNIIIQNNDMASLVAANAICDLASTGPNKGVVLLNNRLENLNLATYTTIGFLCGASTRLIAMGNVSMSVQGVGREVSINGVLQTTPDYMSGPIGAGLGGITGTLGVSTVAPLASPFAILDSTQSFTNLQLSDAGQLNLLRGALIMNKDIRRSRQTPTEAVLVSGVDAQLEIVMVTLTAARVVGAPLNVTAGQRLTFILTQGGAGGFAVTWNAVFKKNWADTGNTTGKVSVVSFIYDGTNWQQDGAQSPYV